MDSPSDGSQRATLAQIAERAGVHVSTVSRALDGRGRGVSQDTTAKIQSIARSVGYQRNPAAVALVTQRSLTIGVLLPRLTDIVIASIYEGLAAEARKRGYATLIATSGDDPEIRHQRLTSLLAHQVEGVIVGDARIGGDSVLDELKRRDFPHVLVNRCVAGHPYVCADDILGGRASAHHLIAGGHREVAVLAGLEYASTCVDRTRGFLQVLSEQGLPVPAGRILNGDTDATGGYEAATLLLANEPDTTAIFAVNDFAAIGAMGAARDLGRVPGEDLAIIGFGDVPLAGPTGLTTIHVGLPEMGAAAMTQLLAQIRGEEPPREVLLTPSLIVRSSTAGVRVP